MARADLLKAAVKNAGGGVIPHDVARPPPVPGAKVAPTMTPGDAPIPMSRRLSDPVFKGAKAGGGVARASSGMFRSIAAGADPGRLAGYGPGMAIGAMTGYWGADEGSEAKGAVWGAVGGAIGGKMLRTYSKHGTGMTNAAFDFANKRLSHEGWGPLQRGWTSQRHVVHKGLSGFHSTEGRNHMFRGGAFLAGGAFGAMFASNGNSHRRGFNRNRGNSITR